MSRSSGEICLIVGAGPAGGQAALTLRRLGFDGRVLLAGKEPHPPYERPPLSKQLLTAGFDRDVPVLVPESGWRDSNIEPLLNRAVTGVDLDEQTAEISTGERLAFSSLLFANGARVRTLAIPGSELPNVRYLRTYDDSIALRKFLQPGADIVIIGGGFIGLEVAAGARQQGCAVTIIEMADQLMGRSLPSPLASFFLERHRAEGCDVRLNATPVHITEKSGAANVVLADGESVSGNLVLVGIGVVPNVELAAAAGLEVDNGIVVDEYCRSSHSAVFAAGDVACFPDPVTGDRIRLESWGHALSQAASAAGSICGRLEPYNEVPWFWSDQYDIKLQIAGSCRSYHESVFRGDPESGKFTTFLLCAGKVTGGITVNRGADMGYVKRLIASKTHCKPHELSDSSVKLRSLLKKETVR